MFSVLELIRRRYEYFTPVELKIADFILEHPEDVTHMTVQEISKESQTSDAAVIRFSKRLGLSGIKSLKVELAKELHSINENPLSSNVQIVSDNESTIFQKVFQNTLRVLHSNDTLVDRKNLSDVTKVIAKKERVLLFGAGECLPVSLDFQSKLIELDIPVFVVNDLTTLRGRLSKFTSKDCMITISTNDNPEIMKALRLANERSVGTVSITDGNSYRVDRLSDYTVFFSEEVTNTNLMMTSRIGLYMILDIIFIYLAKYKKHNILS